MKENFFKLRTCVDTLYALVLQNQGGLKGTGGCFLSNFFWPFYKKAEKVSPAPFAIASVLT